MGQCRTRIWIGVLVGVVAGTVMPLTQVTKAMAASPTYVARDLGTLGGPTSVANAVDGPFVVGDSELAQGARHAFSFDLALPEAAATMQDLGTLGGNYSSATALSGTIAVGQSSISNGFMHAFAVNVAVPVPVMVDLGTLGGSGSEAMDVSGTIVVGSAATSDDATGHAFAYDLANPLLGMRDLHTFGSESTAKAVDGSIVVGTAGSGRDLRAFAYDLTKPEQGMLDLGTLGGSTSQARDVSGHLVTGVADLPGNTGVGAFVYDLDHPEQGMHNLGTLYADGDATLGNAISGTVVVGNSNPPGNHSSSAFAYDLSNPDQGMIALGGSNAYGVDGSFVTGYGEVFDGRTTTHSGFVFDLNDPAAGPHYLPTLGGTMGGAVGSVEGAIVVGYSSTQANQSYPYHAVAWRVDNSTPVLTVSPPPTVDATSARGASVAFTASAVDKYDDSPRISCSKAPGSTFAIGATRVSCIARNWAGSTSIAQSFLVNVRGAIPQLQGLIASVKALGLATADTTRLTRPLDAAIAFATTGKKVAAKWSLLAFQRQTDQLVSSDHLPSTTAQSLNSKARQISAVLG
ncbi:MAG: hypothetical protein QOG53_3487 [Frankiales bacterium]|jgi:uncharacterized membrane protein|nr:hypothetical protein [Frankiales bacterium]